MSTILESYFGQWYADHGGLDLDEIHDDVARPEHPLHDRYEWDDQKAGREYRKQQIARDIRLVEIRYVTDDGKAASARAYLANRQINRGTRGYTATDEALQDPETLVYLERSLNLEIRSLERRFAHLKSYVPVLERALAAAREQQRRRRGKKPPPPPPPSPPLPKSSGKPRSSTRKKGAPKNPS